MYLKNITLRGFKSFKTKSQLTFEPGVSVIVGPNGSGKSNIADAISWVLGEQSPKSLRGNSMGDVIFRNKQEELGIAEVSLCFDNKDRELDLDFRDVRITRRVYTEGGSEYYINSSPSRLMDIQEMIADSGIGKGLYTIINQGQINDIAVLKPEERKLIIDEVIGISKHKNRKDKSINKLEKVKEDIDRINDLTQEIKRTMDPLEIEADKAKKYAKASNQLKGEEISLFIAEINKLNSDWEKKKSRGHKLEQEMDKVTKDLELEIENKKKHKKDAGDKLSSYHYWEEQLKKFNADLDHLKGIIELVKSKENVFSTLKGMFEMNLRKSLDQEDIKDRKESLYGKIIEIREIVSGFLKNILSILSGSSKYKEIESDGNFILKKFEKLLQSFNKDEAKQKNRREFNTKLLKICSSNLENAKKLYGTLNDFYKKIETVKEVIYPNFEKEKKKIGKIQGEVEFIDNSIGKINVKKNDLEKSIYKNDLDKESIKQQVENITKYIIDKYNLSVDYIFKHYEPAENLSEVKRNIADLKKIIKDFGNVNPNASIEYERIKKRYDFLQSQKEDLLNSREKLKKLIEEIDQEIENYFMEKFEKIDESFSYYFKILFPLGDGELQLVKKDESSDLGIDLKVDIGNNKFVPLSLLSGGEKSLVAIAFLFSIFSTNLSPFYVFDEADAALDDINIDRFLSLVGKFAENQQIILITHQKKTMEIANTIYGVTMQSDGVSKVFSEKIGENSFAKTD
ncbi:MAG: AAA family ATPase [Actinomycetota bacterium]